MHHVTQKFVIYYNTNQQFSKSNKITLTINLCSMKKDNNKESNKNENRELTPEIKEKVRRKLLLELRKREYLKKKNQNL